MRIAVTFVACALIWGSTFLAIRFGNEATPPVWAATIRLTLASVLLFAIAGAFRMPLPRGKALRGAALWGFFNLGINFTLLYSGEQSVPSGISAVLFATVPLTTALLAAGFHVEALVTRKLVAAVVAIGGGAVIFAGELGVAVPLAGLLTIFGAASAAALANVLLKQAPKQQVIPLNAIGTAVGAAVCLAVSLLLGEPHALGHRGRVDPDPVPHPRRIARCVRPLHLAGHALVGDEREPRRRDGADHRGHPRCRGEGRAARGPDLRRGGHRDQLGADRLARAASAAGTGRGRRASAQPGACPLSTPVACMIDSAIVGPTKVNPRDRRAVEKAAGSRNVRSHRATLPTSSRRSMYAWALAMAERIFAGLRTMPASARSRRSSRAVNRATRSGSNAANAFRYAGRLLKIVDQESPACAPSSVMRSNNAASPLTGRPHSRS